MKTDTNELYVIFLLKKNIRYNIIKIILGYLSIAMPETLKKQKVVIISVGQEYEFTEGCHNYKIGMETTYRGREQPINIGKFNENFKDGKPKCFNCNKYKHIAKECLSKKKEHETRTCFKCDKKEHIARDCKEKQIIKKRKVQEGLDNENKKSEQGFSEDLKQAWYKRSPM